MAVGLIICNRKTSSLRVKKFFFIISDSCFVVCLEFV